MIKTIYFVKKLYFNDQYSSLRKLCSMYIRLTPVLSTNMEEC